MLLLRKKGCDYCVASLAKHATASKPSNALKEPSKISSRLYSSGRSGKGEIGDSSSRCSRVKGSTSGCDSSCATISQCAHTPPSLSDGGSTDAAHRAKTCFYGAQTSAEAAKYCETAIRRDFGYPVEYHAGSFPWLLSAERQRVPIDDLNVHTDSNGLLSAAAQWLPLTTRRSLAHKLNMHMARRALGDQAIANVCDGAAMVLPSVARLLSAISDGSDAAQAVVSGSLSRIFSPLLLARFTSDLQRLRRDNVQLALEVRRINSARIHQIRTQAGPAEAFAALAELQAPRAASAAAAAHNSGIGAAAGYAKPSLRAGLVRQSHRFSSLLGVACAAPIGHSGGIVSNDDFSDNNNNSNIYSSDNSGVGAADVLRAAYRGKTDVRVRVDIELNVDMRYRLIGRHLGPSEYDMHNGTTQVIVDDDATRNLMLTLESSPARASNGADSNGTDGNGDNVLGNVLSNRYEDEQVASSSLPQFEWRVADIDYLISSEMRIQQELREARSL